MDEQTTIHKLYRLNGSRYVHHDTAGPLPAEVESYVQKHNGDYPAYIPLRAAATEFDVGGVRGVAWDGHSPLPSPVMEYVCEHGTLPRRATDAVEAW